MFQQPLGDGRYTTAASWKRFDNQHSRTFQGRTPETFYDIDRTRSTKIAKSRQRTNRHKISSGWSGYKSQSSKIIFSTLNIEFSKQSKFDVRRLSLHKLSIQSQLHFDVRHLWLISSTIALSGFNFYALISPTSCFYNWKQQLRGPTWTLTFNFIHSHR